MKDVIQEGAVCGIDGCETGSAVTPQKNTQTATGQVHDLTIVSDVICPWCYVAKKNLDKALELTGSELQVKVTWRPYELNPKMPTEGMDRREYRSKKFGSWAHSQTLDAQVADAGAKAGVTFHHELMARTPNTFQAHRLIWMAGEEGVQDAVVEAIFRAYFTEGRDVGDTAVLVAIATETGLNQEHAKAFLEGTEATDEVRLEEQTAMAAGISGVPSFILNGEPLFSGALKPELIAAQLREAVLAHAKG
ncbi:MAG: DsbA family oxidoreductase [Nitrospiraceae bacterium]|nr:DsbA family oxidoreductase [Nitrospiraceae bacterium]